MCIYLWTCNFPIYIHRPRLNNSRQALIVHSYLSDGIYEKNTKINCGRWKPPDSQDFFFFLSSNKKSSRELIARWKLKDFSEGNFSQAMLRLLETPEIQMRRLLTKDKIKCLGHHNWQLWFWKWPHSPILQVGWVGVGISGNGLY